MIFEADPEYIASLDSVALVQLMKRLMLAESRLAGIPLRGAAVPLQITVADGGEDGRVEWSGGQAATEYFPSRFTIFQSKAQNLSESLIKREVLKKQKRGRPKLSQAILDVLAKRGAYVVFCGRPLVNKREKLVKAIRAAIIEGGGQSKRAAAIEVYDANMIADWVNTHPAVALWLASRRLGRPLEGFQTYDSWGTAPEIHSVPWQSSDEPRFFPLGRTDARQVSRTTEKGWTFLEAADAIHQFIENDRSIVRVAGPSGFGKTRFVYEALGLGRDISRCVDCASVIYADGSLSGIEATKLALEIADAGLPAIIVLDECSDDLHGKLAQMVQRARSRLRLITLDIESQILQAKDTLLVRVQRAGDEHIRAIARGVAPALSDADVRFVSDLAEGFPRLAVLAAQYNADGRQALESAEQLLSRLIWGGRPLVPEAQKVLEIASLFEWIGIQDRVEDQVSFIASALAQLPASEFVAHLLSFKPRGIVLQRGDFAQVGPVPLAARLGVRYLAKVTPDHLLRFFESAPDLVKASLLMRLRWLDTSPTARSFAHRLLQPDLLGRFPALNTEFGSKCIDHLVHVDPDTVAATVDRVFGDLSLDELQTVREGRRHLVWALEKLVFRMASFDRAARLLRRLGSAENEAWGNNATGEFKRLYQLHLSGTEAPPTARLLVLDEGLASRDLRERQLCVDALGVMLTTGHFSRGGGSEQIGSREPLEDWAPRTAGEVWEFYRAAVTRLTTIAVSNDPLAANAKGLMGSHIRGLVSNMPLSEVADMIAAVTAHSGFWPEALSGISHWLYFDRRESPPSFAHEVRSLFDRLMPTDPVDLAVLYTNGWQSDLYDPDTVYDDDRAAKNDFEYSLRQARTVAERIAKQKRLVERAVKRLACSEANSAFAFAQQLARSSRSPSALFKFAVTVAEANSAPPNRGFFAGLVAGATEVDPRAARDFIRTALRSAKLKSAAISLIGSGPLQADDFSLVISLLRSKDIEPWQCASLAYSKDVSLDLVVALFLELERYGSDGLWTILDIFALRFHGGTRPTKSLVRLIKRVLLASELFEKTRGGNDGHHLEVAIRLLVKMGEVTKAFAAALTKQLLRICQRRADRLFYELDTPVRKALGMLVALHPQAVWTEIAKALTSRSWYVRFHSEHLLAEPGRDDHLSRGIAFHVPPDVYMKWVREDPKKRAALAIGWLPIAAKDADGHLRWDAELLEFLDEFGERDGVLNALASRLLPTSYWGSRVRFLEPLVPLLETWRTHKSALVRRWADGQIDWVRRTIPVEVKRSEEDVVRLA